LSDVENARQSPGTTSAPVLVVWARAAGANDSASVTPRLSAAVPPHQRFIRDPFFFLNLLAGRIYADRPLKQTTRLPVGFTPWEIARFHFQFAGRRPRLESTVREL